VSTRIWEGKGGGRPHKFPPPLCPITPPPSRLGKTAPVLNHAFYVPSFALLVCLSPQPKAQPPGGTAPFFVTWVGVGQREREDGGGGRCPPAGLPRDGAAAPELGGAAAAGDEEVAEDADVARNLDPHEPLQPLRSCRREGGAWLWRRGTRTINIGDGGRGARFRSAVM